ncbi:MAG: DNA polymerase III subunit delta' [Gammaproteobacteria bacterium RBG_16_51_14]|nr:MAG: DNA polymerase III subunit delta' [Gammaproteobacteria bacterium RBG_16_51_14]
MNQWQHLQHVIKHDRLPHALLLTGADGIGLNDFAIHVVADLLCESRGDKESPCGACKGCHLRQAGNHPDLFLIGLEEKSKQISVEQVRDLIEFMTLKSHAGGYKIAVINPAEAMNRSAANTLLKTLEEPPPQSLLLLLSHRPALLPVTIRSRCQCLVFNGSKSTETIRWLAEQLGETVVDPVLLLSLTGGVPLQAKALIEDGGLECRKMVLADLQTLQRKQADPVKVAERWKEHGTAETLHWLTELIIDMVRLKLTGETSRLTNQDVTDHLQRLIKTLDLKQLVDSHDLAQNNWHQVSGPFNLNSLGLLEEMATHWLNLGIANGE